LTDLGLGFKISLAHKSVYELAAVQAGKREFAMRLWSIILLGLAIALPAPVTAEESDLEIQDAGRTLLGRLVLAEGKALSDGAVLITHGTLAHHRMELVMALQTALAERGINSLSHTLSLGIDRRKGMYDCAQPFDAEYSDDLREIGLWAGWLTDHGASSIILLGHSRGAVETAAAAPTLTDAGVSGVVLMAPSVGGNMERRTASYKKRFDGDLAAILQRAAALVAAGQGGEMIKVPGFLYCPDTSASARAIVSNYADHPARDIRALLPALPVPGLIIAASDDQVVGDLASKLGDLVDGEKLRLEVVEDAGHMFLDFFAEDAADLITGFATTHFAAAAEKAASTDWPIIDLKLAEVLPGYVYSAIGATLPPSYANSGHNNNLSFIITSEGVVVVNGGATNLLARSIHAKIRELTDQPVIYVIIENGQGHAFLGSHYWAQQGVPVIAQSAAHTEITEHGGNILARSASLLKEKIQDTGVHVPEIVFDESHELVLGGKRIIALTFGPAHAAGDTSVWLPDDSLILTGDMAFHERLLAVFPETVTGAWVESFGKMQALNPKYVIPGHGGPTTMEEVTKYTKGYLLHLRAEVQKILDNDGGLMDAYKIDQSAYAHLDTFKELAVKNASRVFAEMELEFF
jgi:glyoxylase-like metal-dependent hydrolase (beta-lactamase superfamily II)/pimeloyl-ACP methyl ester carboxylesterase